MVVTLSMILTVIVLALALTSERKLKLDYGLKELCLSPEETHCMPNIHAGVRRHGYSWWLVITTVSIPNIALDINSCILEGGMLHG